MDQLQVSPHTIYVSNQQFETVTIKTEPSNLLSDESVPNNVPESKNVSTTSEWLKDSVASESDTTFQKPTPIKTEYIDIPKDTFQEENNAVIRLDLEREYDELNPIDPPANACKNLNSKFPCDVCKEEYAVYADLRKHKQLHYIEKRTCDICNVVCQNLGKLEIHRNLHLGLKPYQCQVCKKNFTCKDQLRIHNRIHTDEKPYQCKNCDKTFRFLGSLRSHEVTHTGLIDFKCKKCYRICPNAKALRRHTKLHERESNFFCHLCSRNFTCERSLQNHIKSHKELKYPCDYCQKVHETLFKLKRHIKRAHIPNVCEDCNEVYYDRAEFTKHRKTHKVEEPAICTICSKDFKKEKNLREHIRLQHTKDGRSHSCPICNKDFINHSLLNNHIKTHDKSFKCPDCDKVFSSRYNLETHSVVHTKERNHQCPICLNFYTTKTSLKNHIDTHNTVKSFQCDQCAKMFKSSRRLYVHKYCHITEEKFFCQLCDGRFKTKQYLKFHMIKHSEVKPFECKACNKKFKHKKSWEKHAKHDQANSVFVNSGEDFECYYCEEYFPTKTLMLEHVRHKHEETAEFPMEEEYMDQDGYDETFDQPDHVTLQEMKQEINEAEEYSGCGNEEPPATVNSVFIKTEPV